MVNPGSAYPTMLKFIFHPVHRAYNTTNHKIVCELTLLGGNYRNVIKHRFTMVKIERISCFYHNRRSSKCSFSAGKCNLDYIRVGSEPSQSIWILLFRVFIRHNLKNWAFSLFLHYQASFPSVLFSNIQFFVTLTTVFFKFTKNILLRFSDVFGPQNIYFAFSNN